MALAKKMWEYAFYTGLLNVYSVVEARPVCRFDGKTFSVGFELYARKLIIIDMCCNSLIVIDCKHYYSLHLCDLLDPLNDIYEFPGL